MLSKNRDYDRLRIAIMSPANAKGLSISLTGALYITEMNKVINMNVLLVMIGGFFGAISRFAMGGWIYTNNGFPLGTLLINLIGCFLLGWFLTFVSQKEKIKSEITLIIGAGFVGSFTTFSTFSLETINLFQRGFMLQGILYILATVILGLAFTYLGSKLALPKERTGDVQ
ncbi:MAG TPA: fluoride efflux transporter CrcB [Lentibacillus sp.]|uniref:fluoride efflux transporter CrcB n=1 Tax=Lentibacillus sp. TaxID=1925746 RepID=UPI002B4B65F1|nr:fluoride efflux transporter CrcB [Lentibacillus sp.]HLR63495.1 fluoride efflux transporter CrcB [Lentibacillus sp.]